MASPSTSELPVVTTNGPVKRTAVRNSVITLGGYAASTGVRFVSNLIITRLLVPEQFGIMALVNVFITGLYLFSDIGIGPNIIQNPRGDDPVFLNTAWTVQVLRGMILWVAACLLAWPLARFYARPELLYLLPVVGLSAPIGGLESTRLFTQNRRLALGRVSVVELISQVSGIVAMLLSAAATHSIWSLVIGALVSALVKTALSHTVLPGERNRFAWDASSRKSLIDFGRWIFVSTAITFLSGQSDRLILAKLVSDSRLGLYAIAVNLAVLPANIIGQLSQRVLFPIIADTLRRGGHDWSSIRRNHTHLLLVMAPIIAMGIVLAPPAVSLMYRSAYWEVGTLTSYLTVGTWLGAVSTSYTVVLMAAGRPKYMSLGSVAKILLFTTFVFVVASRYGVPGVAVLVSLSELGYLGVAMFGCGKIGVVAWKSDLAITAFGFVYMLGCKLLYGVVLGYLTASASVGLVGARAIAIAIVVAATAAVVFGLVKRLKLL